MRNPTLRSWAKKSLRYNSRLNILHTNFKFYNQHDQQQLFIFTMPFIYLTVQLVKSIKKRRNKGDDKDEEQLQGMNEQEQDAMTDTGSKTDNDDNEKEGTTATKTSTSVVADRPPIRCVF